MKLRVQSVGELSPAERRHLQDTLMWMKAEGASDWETAQWCVTLENSTLTLAMLVDTVEEGFFEETVEALPA